MSVNSYANGINVQLGKTSLRPFISNDRVQTLDKVLKSELKDVSDAAWTNFILALKTASLGSISASNSFGMFELRPKRLCDLKMMTKPKSMRSPNGRLIWAGNFIVPLTQKIFLCTPGIQYKALVLSLKHYIDGIENGQIFIPKYASGKGMTLSGALSILHRSGPNGLKNWIDEKKRFPETVALYEKCNGIF